MSNFENVTILNSCPQCHRLIEFDSYFSRYYCTSCDWRSEKICNNDYQTVVERVAKVIAENILLWESFWAIEEEIKKAGIKEVDEIFKLINKEIDGNENKV
jgi:hypothetical protein